MKRKRGKKKNKTEKNKEKKEREERGREVRKTEGEISSAEARIRSSRSRPEVGGESIMNSMAETFRLVVIVLVLVLVVVGHVFSSLDLGDAVARVHHSLANLLGLASFPNEGGCTPSLPS